MITAGENDYISDVSENPNVRAKQLWQFLAGKEFFRLSCLSQGQYLCPCGTHTTPFLTVKCSRFKPSRYSLADYPCDIATDGYVYNHSCLEGCHKKIFM